MRPEPNPLRDPKPFQRVALGGRHLVAILLEVNGVKVVDKWNVQTSKETNGAVAVFAGTGILEDLELTLGAFTADGFDDLRDTWDQLAPKPVGGTGTAATGAGSTTAIGSPYSAAASSGPGQGAAAGSAGVIPAADTGGVGQSTGTETPVAGKNPGPRPPTVTIDNAIVNFVGCMAVARKSWEGPIWVKEGNYWIVKLGLIQNKPPTPAGTGAMGAAKTSGSQFVQSGYDPEKAAEASKKRLEGQAGGV